MLILFHCNTHRCSWLLETKLPWLQRHDFYFFFNISRSLEINYVRVYRSRAFINLFRRIQHMYVSIFNYISTTRSFRFQFRYTSCYIREIIASLSNYLLSIDRTLWAWRAEHNLNGKHKTKNEIKGVRRKLGERWIAELNGIFKMILRMLRWVQWSPPNQIAQCHWITFTDSFIIII